ncbi:MAG: dienelactone hydrolase family protein [Deltaproteobacteria bacterium]|nr:dienelactone hydrolase family protein [Deltaproteobacteria bacterium]
MSLSQKILLLLCFSLLVFIGCRPMDYLLLHPLQPYPGIGRENEFFDRGQVRVHWLAHYPDQKEPLPAVLVHPDAGGLAEDMEGICFTLARAGYFAAAVHYQRRGNLSKKNPLFPWKSPEEITVAWEHLRQHPRVNPQRIGLLGFSKGGMLSLLIAAQEKGVRAVVAYYPLADFEEWLDISRYPFPKSLLYRGIRRHFMKELEASTWEEALNMLRAASPIHQAACIQSPVLLIHGEKDRTAPLEQVQRLCAKMRSAGKNCELLTLPGAGHVFNFRDEEKGQIAWEKTLQFLQDHVKKPLLGATERGQG